MEIENKGANCIAISNKKDSFVTDPGLSKLGLKDQGAGATAILLTQTAFGVNAGDDTLVIDGPGEYEVRDFSIKGIAARRYSEMDDKLLNATVYRLDNDGVSLAIMGHVDPNFSDKQLEDIGVVDVLILPVGGNGYTLDAKAAVDLVRKIEPKIVIPTHYADGDVKYEVPQQPLDDFIKEMGASVEEVPKLKLKAGVMPVGLTVYKITRSK